MVVVVVVEVVAVAVAVAAAAAVVVGAEAGRREARQSAFLSSVSSQREILFAVVAGPSYRIHRSLLASFQITHFRCK